MMGGVVMEVWGGSGGGRRVGEGNPVWIVNGNEKLGGWKREMAGC